MNIRHVHIVLGISGQFGGARTVVWPHPCVENACATHIKRTHSIEYNVGLVPIFEQLNYGKSAPIFWFPTTLDNGCVTHWQSRKDI